MLDIQYIRDNPELVEQKSKQKGYPVDIKALLKADSDRRSLHSEADELRRQRNELTDSMKGRPPHKDELSKGKKLKDELSAVEDKLKSLDEEYLNLIKAVPNMPLDNVPIGASEEENQVVKTVGEVPKFEFEPKAHHQIGESRELIDKQRAAKIAGSRFAYLRGDLVRLQFAIIQFVMSELCNESIIEGIIKDSGLSLAAKPFIPILPPAMLRTDPYVASARLNAEEVTYKIEQDDLWLNASAEHTLATMYMDEIIPESILPLRFLGYSTSFRREAGTYGKDMEGIFRLHQFDKLEMEVLSTPETGLEEHKLLVAIQEYLMNKIGLSYQLIQKCTADIGKPNAIGVDINAWFPAQNTYRETHTADYMTDYQSRDLKIRVRRENGSLELVHTNDATAFALGRIMAPIMENFQTKEGKIQIPEPLRSFMGGQELL
jgi:seryl-tRNA synthetase